MRAWLVTLGVTALACAAVLQAQTADVLQGLLSVRVVIHGIDQAARDTGLSEDSLRTVVALRLRQRGIQVDQESSSEVSVTVSLVEVTAGVGEGGYAYGTDVQLVDNVYLRRQVIEVLADAGIAGPTALDFTEEFVPRAGITWQTRRVGVAPRNGAPTFIRDSVLRNADEFADAYLAANAR